MALGGGPEDEEPQGHSRDPRWFWGREFLCWEGWVGVGGRPSHRKGWHLTVTLKAQAHSASRGAGADGVQMGCVGAGGVR